MKKVSPVLITLILALGALSNAYAASYTYTPLNYPGASETLAFGINDAGTIVGYYKASGVYHGFSLNSGTYTSLNYPGASYTTATGINNAGTIVGSYKANGVNSAYSLSGATFTSIAYPGAPETYIIGNAINNAGTIVGGYYTTPPDMDNGFSLSGTTYTSFSYGALRTWANSINDAGTIVGAYYDASGVTQGYSLSGTTFTLINYPGASSTEAIGINNAGTIVGLYKDANGVYRGFFLSNGTYATLNYPGASSTGAAGINNVDTIVGVYWDTKGVQHGFLANPVPDLPPEVNPPEGTLGTQFNITGFGFGTKKSKVLVNNTAVKVLDWTDNMIRCSITKAFSPGTYDVIIQPSKAFAITLEDAFSIRPPEIESVEPVSGSVGDEITVKGLYFGNKKGKVSLGGKNCKVLSWTMDSLTGESTIRLLVAKGVPLGVRELKIINSMGNDTTDFTVD
jgi:hypothetical protein